LREIKDLLKTSSRTSSERNEHLETPRVKRTEYLKHVLNCPECYPQFKSEILKKEGLPKPEKTLKDLWSERGKYDLECTNCGLPVSQEEEKCPSCGSTKARKRVR
jgi:rubrerythrin